MFLHTLENLPRSRSLKFEKFSPTNSKEVQRLKLFSKFSQAGKGIFPMFFATFLSNSFFAFPELIKYKKENLISSERWF